MTAVQSPIETYERDASDLVRHFTAHDIPFDLHPLVSEIRVASVDLCKRVLFDVVSHFEAAERTPGGGGEGGGGAGAGGGGLAGEAREKRERGLLEKAVQFAFRCHQFAGGFDGRASQLFARSCELLQLRLDLTVRLES
jgi:hypothetical protein